MKEKIHIKVKASVNGSVYYTTVKVADFDLLKIKQKAVCNLRNRIIKEVGRFNLTDILYFNNGQFSRFPF